ncbi:MAG: TMEM175 family protein [Thaumarchaeota archaeon]|nr:TMEM175 family protein [Nitrososphaerota archaeon]
MESLSDMIFGLALSVGAITLVGSPPTDVPSIYSDLATFGFSFLILITIWLRYTRIMSVLPLETERGVVLNITLLFLVSVEPFLFNIVRNPPTVLDYGPYGDAISTLYALDLGAMMVILGIFTFSATAQEKKLIPDEFVGRFKIESITWLITGGLFLVTVLPFFFTFKVHGMPLRYAFWVVPMLFIFTVKTLERITVRMRDHRDGV